MAAPTVVNVAMTPPPDFGFRSSVVPLGADASIRGAYCLSAGHSPELSTCLRTRVSDTQSG